MAKADFIVDGQGFKVYKGDKLTIEESIPKEFRKQNQDMMVDGYKYITQGRQDGGIYDLPLRDFTMAFCNLTGKGIVEQFKMKAPFLKRRSELIQDATVYRFKEKFVTLLVENNKNDWGFRNMERDNMWIEVDLQLKDVVISGIHLHKIWLSDDDDTGYQVYSDEIRPPNFNTQGISIFVSGIAGGKSQFYNYFTLGKMTPYEQRKKKVSYVCPCCNCAMKKSQVSVVEYGKKNPIFYHCDEPQCVRHYQENVITMYDLNDKKVKDKFRVMKMNNVWSVEDEIRNFVCNLLDFMNNREVKVIQSLSGKELRERNLKRAKRGKRALPPINLITVDGSLKRYVSFIKEKTDGNFQMARNETWVKGHFFRFWDKDKWTRLYAWIKKAKTDEEIQERLNKWVREDGDGNVLPLSEQYQWDKDYKVIKVWKKPFIKFKGEGIEKDRINVLRVDDR